MHIFTKALWNSYLNQYQGDMSHAYKLWGDLRLRGQSLDRNFLLQYCIDQALASFIAA